ncbi:unnamed protein product [Lasius platythorax]|uniref:Uncharacterized protein n=1 Tax=Lasius platythorax TaxID=488582 RepID=A0AAV2N6Y5_9HYME
MYRPEEDTGRTMAALERPRIEVVVFRAVFGKGGRGTRAPSSRFSWGERTRCGSIIPAYSSQFVASTSDAGHRCLIPARSAPMDARGDIWSEHGPHIMSLGENWGKPQTEITNGINTDYVMCERRDDWRQQVEGSCSARNSICNR